MSGLFDRASAKIYASLLVLLALAPLILHGLDQPFYLDLLIRTLIFAIAAVSLNLILGYGGMISLGHAAYLGIGAYCVGIPSYYDIYNGWIHLALTLSICASFALITGAISLRTRGVYFLMITMAFSQMAYFIFLSLDEYGADDGLIIYGRSEFPSWMSLQDNISLYYWVFLILLASLLFTHRLIGSRFGRVIVGTKFNENRMRALGYNTYAYQLMCYVLSAMICGLAGFLMANFTEFISPDLMSWTRSGELIFMLIIGGVGSLFGAVTGTIAFMLLEEALSAITVYWHLIFGLLLIALVMYGKGGLHGWIVFLDRKESDHD